MTRIIVKKIKQTNWKGGDDEVEFGPGENRIIAENGRGKSRLMDSYIWSLTGKDAAGRSDFEIKNLKDTNKNRLDHVVENTLVANGKVKVLERTYKEMRSKVRGTETLGPLKHTTEYRTNGQDRSATEYSDYIREILGSEDALRMVSDPLFFNTDRVGKWDWKNRREILIKMVGEINSMDILMEAEKINGKLDTLRKLIEQDLPLEPQLGTLKNQLKKLKERFDEIPIRIEEAANSKPLETEEDFKKIEANIEDLSLEDAKLIEQISNAGARSKAMNDEYLIHLSNYETAKREFDSLVSLAKESELRKKRDKQNEVSEIEGKISAIERSITSDQAELELVKRKSEANKNKITELRSKFSETKAKPFSFDPSKYEDRPCPECGQIVKKGHNLVETSRKLEETFNESKAQKLESIKTEASEFTSLSTKFSEQTEGLERSISEKKTQLDSLKLEVGLIEKFSMPTDEEIKSHVLKTEEGITAQQKVEHLFALIPERKGEPGMDDVKDKRREIADKRHQLTLKLSGREEIRKVNDRITTLEKEEKEKSQEIANVEKDIYQIELFNKTNMELVESRVNDMFEDVSFQLFETQLNGGINQICTMIFEGKTWSALNTAAKVWAGIQCIKALQKFYDLYAPIFVDNRESILRIPEVDCQVINLEVVEGVKKLTVKL